MKLQINGEVREFGNAPVPFTLAALIESLAMKADRVAVELNRDIAPRDRWAQTALNEGDQLEIVHFVGGGAQR
jgi:thiamine biosynthesis protein ThiS